MKFKRNLLIVLCFFFILTTSLLGLILRKKLDEFVKVHEVNLIKLNSIQSEIDSIEHYLSSFSSSIILREKKIKVGEISMSQIQDIEPIIELPPTQINEVSNNENNSPDSVQNDLTSQYQSKADSVTISDTQFKNEDSEVPSEIDSFKLEKMDLSDSSISHEELIASNEPLRVRRGRHLLELPEGNYVVAGAFQIFAHAEDYSDKLFEEGFHDVLVGYVSARGYYYVIVFYSYDLTVVREKRIELERIKNLQNLWTLQVVN